MFKQIFTKGGQNKAANESNGFGKKTMPPGQDPKPTIDT